MHSDTLEVLVQPTPRCNLNCTYCYLPGRDVDLRMSVKVADRIADSFGRIGGHIHLIWHSGEPLVTGIAHLTALLDRFENLRCAGVLHHSVQTNGTLITPEWCDVFRHYGIRVGISLDGPPHLNSGRGNLAGCSTFLQVADGLDYLRASGLEFDVLAVVTEQSLACALELYEFFVALGCRLLGLNVVDRQGTCTVKPPDDQRVTLFWSELFRVWVARPAIQIREFRSVLTWMAAVSSCDYIEPPIQLLPTIGANGDVVLLSPEFLGLSHPDFSTFAVANVLTHDLAAVIREASSHTYVRQHLEGVECCRSTCKYFSYCLGGRPSNKLLENRSIRSTETVACRNSRIRLVDAVLNAL